MAGETAEVLRLADAGELAERSASDVLDLLRGIQAEGRVPSLILTGGSIVRQVHARMAAGQGVDWSAVDVWWGDERYLPAGDAERNATTAWEDLLNRVPVDPLRVHEMPASDSGHPDVASAASAYAHEVRRAVDARVPGEPWFDVLMLGIGPDGHCASLFPGHDEVHATGSVVPVTDSPKPPPTRITLTMPVLRRAAHVVFMANGSAKADAVRASVEGTDVDRAPAAGPRGLVSTRWYVDAAAASRLA